MTYDSRPDTKAHIRRVHDLLMHCNNNIIQRARIHDNSKLEEPEKSVFDEVTPKLKAMTYGSDEYKASLAEMGEALTHHYAHNSHHPEHHKDGIEGMSLFDVVEMLMDWKAATERHTDGDIHRSIVQNAERFGYPPMLQSIFENTARELGWEVVTT
ncbi:MAG: DUF5662 family protein [Chloroflexota bacterium]|nr:DUF5662 family protein [Chloroflexota bacterium]